MGEDKKIKVFYAGMSLSGRYESIKNILKMAHPPVDINGFLTDEGKKINDELGGNAGNSLLSYGKNAAPWECVWKFKSKFYDCQIAKSNKIALLPNNLYFSVEDVTNLSPEPYQREIEFMREIDGIVFVIDLQKQLQEANLRAFNQLIGDLEFIGRKSSEIPLVFQANKFDLGSLSEEKSILNKEEVENMFKWNNCKYIPSSNVLQLEESENYGIGVREAFDTLLEMITSKY